jgi:hypothetical protein
MNTAERIQQEIEQEREKGAIIFLPSAIVPESFYRPVMEKIWLTDEDLYCAQKQWRIRYEGLLKLGNAAGIEWSPVDSGRTDNGSDKLYVSFRAVGLIRKADGKLYPTAANYDLDLELVKEELEEQYRQKADSMKKSTKEKEDYIRYCVTRDWLHKRKHKATLAESGAKARVIRSILGLQSQYSNKNDLVSRPFLMVRFVLDHQNPDIKQAMLSAARDNMSAIYGGHANSLPAPQPRFESVVDESIDITPHYDDMDPGVIDFENADVQEQCLILESLCKDKNYNLNDFLSRVKRPLEKLSPEKRTEFFNHLNTL